MNAQITNQNSKGAERHMIFPMLTSAPLDNLADKTATLNPSRSPPWRNRQTLHNVHDLNHFRNGSSFSDNGSSFSIPASAPIAHGSRNLPSRPSISQFYLEPSECG